MPEIRPSKVLVIRPSRVCVCRTGEHGPAGSEGILGPAEFSDAGRPGEGIRPIRVWRCRQAGLATPDSARAGIFVFLFIVYPFTAISFLLLL